MNAEAASADTSVQPIARRISQAEETAAANTPPASDRIRLGVHFIPRWPNNPYHAELARHLENCDVFVSQESRLKQIYYTARSTGILPAIIHLHALPAFGPGPFAVARLMLFWIRLRRLRACGVKVVWTIHNITDHESIHPRIDRLLCRWFYEFADAVIVHSQGAHDLIQSQWRPKRQHRVFIVHHGHFIDCYPMRAGREEARARLHVVQDAMVFLFLGNIRPYKGVQNLVRDFKAVATSGMHLIIAGATLTDKLKADINQEIGSSEFIDFRPAFVPNDEIQYYMAAADVVVFPYTKTLTSGALILAMSFGRACIAPRVGALGDTLDPEGGFLFEPTEAGALRRAIQAAIRNRPYLEKMGIHNRNRATEWGWDEAARRTADAYRACLA
jgi:glycosyltransferase involved in cell wall biosynthesis